MNAILKAAAEVTKIQAAEDPVLALSELMRREKITEEEITWLIAHFYIMLRMDAVPSTNSRSLKG